MMNDSTDSRQPATVGLCARCAHAREIVSATGSRFVLCDRSKTDARFPRYPRLPVLGCEGYEPPPATA